jgi:hypothetical protein
MESPNEDDFPLGTVFLVKRGYPFASIPDPKTGHRNVYAFGTGKKCGPIPTFDPADSTWPVSMTFPQWLAAVKQAAAEFERASSAPGV